jgi:chromosome segregation ATPase
MTRSKDYYALNALATEIERLRYENQQAKQLISDQTIVRKSLIEDISQLREEKRQLAIDCLTTLAEVVCTPLEGYEKAGMNFIISDIRALVRDYVISENANERLRGQIESYRRKLIDAQYSIICRTSDNEVLRASLAQARAERDSLKSAIYTTLMKNGHLADGDCCTLFALKCAVPEWECRDDD